MDLHRAGAGAAWGTRDPWLLPRIGRHAARQRRVLLLGLGFMLGAIVIWLVAHLPARTAERLARKVRRVGFSAETPSNAILLLRSFDDGTIPGVSGCAMGLLVTRCAARIRWMVSMTS
jgi:hypothetical protein